MIARRPLLMVIPLTLVAFACSEQPTSPDSVSSEYLAAANRHEEVATAQSPPLTATIQFGRNNIGSPFPPPEGHDASTHAKDALQPRTVVISAGGTVTFDVAEFHKAAIYEDGVEPDDIDTTLLEGAGLPIPFPPVINDPDGRITRGALAFPSPLTFEWTFEEPGRYLVICEVLPHFAANDMYGWVIVK